MRLDSLQQERVTQAHLQQGVTTSACCSDALVVKKASYSNKASSTSGSHASIKKWRGPCSAEMFRSREAARVQEDDVRLNFGL